MLKRSKVLTGLGIFLMMWIIVWYYHGKLTDHRNPLPHSEQSRTLQVDADNAAFGPREYIRIHRAEWKQDGDGERETFPPQP